MMIDDSYWNDILDRLGEGKLIPIISNSLLLGQVFYGQACRHAQRNVDEQIAEEWAKEQNYLLPDISNLANVAQYNYFKERNILNAKSNYMKALKELLLSHLKAHNPEKSAEAQRYASSNISHFLNDLNLPDWDSDASLNKLFAIKDIKVYITTSYFTILDRAFDRPRGGCYSEIYGENDGDQPNVIYFKGQAIQEKYDRRIMKHPLVYYLFGNDSNPEKMVLAEDDHIKFLVDACQPVDRNKNTTTSLPGYIKAELNQNSLLFLGFRWKDWEFRTLFRLVTHIFGNNQFLPRFFIQLDPDFNQEIEKAKEHFGPINYFTLRNFTIFEKDTNEFIEELSQKHRSK